jgi:hypothetical protein
MIFVMIRGRWGGWSERAFVTSRSGKNCADKWQFPTKK